MNITFPNLIIYAIPFFTISIVVEFFLVRKNSKDKYQIKDAITSMIMGFIGNVLIGIISKTLVLFLFYFIYDNFRIVAVPIVWWSFVLLFFIDDFTYYWFHRTSHKIRFFWSSHVVHHSSEQYNLSTALRQTWTGGFFGFIFWIWLVIIGFHPAMIILQMAISLLYQFWIHTETIKKLPKWFEFIFNTPSHHSVHHGSNPIYLDRNHAGILIIWDRLFGTFQPELEAEKVVYGLVTNIKTYNLLTIAFHEWISMFKTISREKVSLIDKFRYLIKPPGWKHDGTGIMSDDLRKEWLEKQ